MALSIERGGLEISVVDGRVLERVALALNSTLSPREVLHDLADVTREITAAGRVTLFMWDGSTLEPAIALGSEPDDVLWEAFRDLGPVTVSPEQAVVLESRCALGITDAAAEPLIPEQWVDRFHLQSLAIVPLHAGDQARGVMVVDYPDRRVFAQSELDVLEAIGAYAGVALRNATLYERAQRSAHLQGTVARASSGLAWPAAPGTIAAQLAVAFDELLATGGSTVWRFEPDARRLRLLAPSRVGGPGVAPVQALPDDLARYLLVPGPTAVEHISVVDGVQGLVLAPRGQGRCLVVPLPAEDQPAGVVVVPLDPRARLDPDAREAVAVLAALGGAALEREALLTLRERQVHQLAVLYRLSAMMAEHADAELICARLSELLGPDGFAVTGVAYRQRDLARHLGGDRPTAAERASWDDGSWVEGSDGTVGVPMRLGERVVGTLRVLPAKHPDPSWRSFLEIVATGVGELSTRSALRAALEQARRERALSQERERIAAEVHDTVGGALATVEGRLRRVAEQLPDDLPARRDLLGTAGLADGAKWELEQAIRALAFVPSTRRGLVAALRGLAAQVHDDSGISVLVELAGRPARLPGRVERALYRVASEALAAAWRDARCSVVRVDLVFEKAEVVLRLTDDGVGLSQRQVELAPGLGLMRMRRGVEDIGGRIRFSAAKPHGMELEVRVWRSKR